MTATKYQEKPGQKMSISWPDFGHMSVPIKLPGRSETSGPKWWFVTVSGIHKKSISALFPKNFIQRNIYIGICPMLGGLASSFWAAVLEEETHCVVLKLLEHQSHWKLGKHSAPQRPAVPRIKFVLSTWSRVISQSTEQQHQDARKGATWDSAPE